MKQGPYRSKSTFTCYRIKEDFEPVGDPEMPVWQVLPKSGFATSYLPEILYPEIRTEVASAWTSEYIYFAFWCPYLELNLFESEDPEKETWELWNRDVAEVFLNPYPERLHEYFEFEVAPNNLWVDLTIDVRRDPIWGPIWDSGFRHGTRIDPDLKVWFCDMRIAASVLGVNRIEAGMEWRFNLYRCDGPGDDSQRRFLAWSPTYNSNFHTPERFGRLFFSPEIPPGFDAQAGRSLQEAVPVGGSE